MKRYSSNASILIQFLILFFLLSCSQEPRNSLEGIKDQTIRLSKWIIIGPLKDTLRNIDLIDSLKGAAIKGYDPADSAKKSELNSLEQLKHFVYRQKPETNVVDLGELFNVDQNAVAYATCDVYSERDQEINFYVKADEEMRLWVNQKQVAHLDFTLGKSVKISLQKGSNRFIAEVKNKSSVWFFSISASKLPKKDVYEQQFYVRPKNALLNVGDQLSFVINNRNYIAPKKVSKLEILDINEKVVKRQAINIVNSKGVELSDLKNGSYLYKLFTDRDTFTGYFCYGHFETLDESPRLLKKYSKNIRLYNEIIPYKVRLDTLTSAYEKGPNALLSSKISYCVFKISQIINSGMQNHGTLYDVGLSLRKYKSSIDRGDEYYMMYVPERFKLDKKPMPLAVIVPYVTYTHPFYSGAIVANTERINYIARYAERYGIAVLWPSSRIYKDYNETPIVTKSILETLEDVEKRFNIDKRHMFLYGDCSGGLFALQTAVRRPDLFSAIAVEGPELTSIDFREPLHSGKLSNNLFNLTANFHGKSIFFLHSINDFKAPFKLSARLMDSIKRNGGTVYYDNLQGDAKYNFVKLYSEPENMGKVFKFFDKQLKSIPTAEKKIATYGFYSDTVYGLFVKNKIREGRALVSYQINGQRIYFRTENINSFIIHPYEMGFKPGKSIEVYLNGTKIRHLILKNNGAIDIQVFGNKKMAVETEVLGPINRTFVKSFAVVRSENGSQQESNIISALDSLWLAEYRNHIVVVNSKELASTENKGLNLIYIVKNLREINKSIIANSEISQSAGIVKVKGKPTSVSGTSFAFHVKRNQQSDDLYIGTNAASISLEMLISIIKEGWNDYEIWQGEYPILQSSYKTQTTKN